MANTREIKNRIESVQQTRKITNAMYLIASTKLRKARNDLANTRPYFDALRGEIKRVFRTAGDVDSPYFYPPDNNTPLEGTYGCLVITADKGLAGAYNQNVIKEAEKLLAQHPDTKLYVVGEYGRRYFDQHKIPIEHSFLYTAQNPTLDRAREISAWRTGSDCCCTSARDMPCVAVLSSRGAGNSRPVPSCGYRHSGYGCPC